MKVAYDVDYKFKTDSIGTIRFRGQETQRDAFNIAKREAAKRNVEVFMTEIKWDDNGHIVSYETVIVRPDGKFRKI